MNAGVFWGARKRSFGFFVGAAVALAGCAALDPRPSHEIVKARAQARWDALVKSDFKTAYGFLSPGSRSVVSAEGWAGALRAGFWKSAVVEKAVCEAPETCEVHTTIEYEHRLGRVKAPLRETWIKESGHWWYVQK